ncbi:MAG: hypothetical protein GXY41_06020 [Phycisphaerae bacterium]|nr:hypothetical protein [Phycisphaerae bacterium]
MKLEHIKIGNVYDIKVGKNTSAVRITKPIPTGGFEAVTLATSKTVVIKSADRIVGPHNPKADKQPKPATTPATVDPAPFRAKPLSALDAAAKVLAEAKVPLNCKQMIDAMTAEGYWKPSQGGKTPANTLHAAIGTEIKKKGDAARFEKVGRGQFGLRMQ